MQRLLSVSPNFQLSSCGFQQHAVIAGKYQRAFFLLQQKRFFHAKPNKAKKQRQKALVNWSEEQTKGKAETILDSNSRKKFLTDRYEAQVRELRKQYFQEYNEAKQQNDENSRQAFFAWRDKVLAYREQKRRVSLQNIKQHENYMYHLKTEYDRIRREKNQERLNRESVMSSYRIDSLRRLANESQHFVTAENVDQHISSQLAPLRVVVPTIFYNKFGINDEVGYEVWYTILKEHEFQLKKQQKELTSFRLAREQQEEDEFIKDPLYPHIKRHYDVQDLIPYEDLLEKKLSEELATMSKEDLEQREREFDQALRSAGFNPDDVNLPDMEYEEPSFASRVSADMESLTEELNMERKKGKKGLLDEDEGVSKVISDALSGK
jgi:hypothetical protein